MLNRILITYRTIVYCALMLSLTCNYLVYTGKLSMTGASQAVAADTDYLTTLASSDPMPVVLKKGKR